MTMVIAGSIPLRPDASERGLAAFAAVAAGARQAPGCRAYAVAVDLFQAGDDGIRKLETFTRNMGRD